MSTITQHLTAADKAQAAADKAQAAADAARAAADKERAKAQAELDRRIQSAAREVVEGFEQTILDHRAAVNGAHAAFDASVMAAKEFTTIRDLYVAWNVAVMDMHLAYTALQQSCADLGLHEYRNGPIPSISERMWPSTFIEAFQRALDRGVNAATDARQEAYHAQRRAVLAGDVS